MARQLILHIGTTKTGSTSIQYAMHAARAFLPSQGVYYPDTDTDVRHTLMATAFASTPIAMNPRNQIWGGRDPQKVVAEYLQSFKREMENLPPEITRVVMSAEQFSHWIRDADDIQRLHDTLAPHFDDIKVVVYLRRQDGHYASNYAQLIRLGRVDPPDMKQLSPFWHDYDYTDLIGRWAASFGEAAMCPRIFERVPGRKFDVVAEFLDLCGVVLPPDLDGAVRERNLSMNLTGQHILKAVESILRGEQKMNADLRSGALWQRIGRAVSKAHPGAGWVPTRTEAAAFMERFAQTNERVRQRWFPDRDRLFSDDFSKLPETAPKIDFEADFKAACGIIVDITREAVRQQQQAIKASSARAGRAKETVRQRMTLARAVKLDGTDIKARLALARLQIAEGALGTAKHHLDAALKSSPGNPIAIRLLQRLERLTERQQRKAESTKPAEKTRALSQIN